jgi:hypothetical protein
MKTPRAVRVCHKADSRGIHALGTIPIRSMPLGEMIQLPTEAEKVETRREDPTFVFWKKAHQVIFDEHVEYLST